MEKINEWWSAVKRLHKGFLYLRVIFILSIFIAFLVDNYFFHGIALGIAFSESIVSKFGWSNNGN